MKSPGSGWTTCLGSIRSPPVWACRISPTRSLEFSGDQRWGLGSPSRPAWASRWPTWVLAMCSCSLGTCGDSYSRCSDLSRPLSLSTKARGLPLQRCAGARPGALAAGALWLHPCIFFQETGKLFPTAASHFLSCQRGGDRPVSPHHFLPWVLERPALCSSHPQSLLSLLSIS